MPRLLCPTSISMRCDMALNMHACSLARLQTFALELLVSVSARSISECWRISLAGQLSEDWPVGTRCLALHVRINAGNSRGYMLLQKCAYHDFLTECTITALSLQAWSMLSSLNCQLKKTKLESVHRDSTLEVVRPFHYVPSRSVHRLIQQRRAHCHLSTCAV